MYERADYAQPFNYGGVIRKLAVFRPQADTIQGSKDFVLLEDLRDHFDLSSTRFEREDGVALTLMRDSHLQRYVPERIPASRDLTINIVSSNKAPISTEKARLPPLSVRSSLRSSPSTTTPSHPTVSETAARRASTSNGSGSNGTRSMAKGSPLPPLPPPPSFDPPNTRKSSLSRVDTQTRLRTAVDPPPPMTPIPESSSSNLHHSIVINIPGGSRLRTVQDTSVMPASFESCVTNGNRSTGENMGGKATTAADLGTEPADLAHEFTAEERQENEAAVIEVLERCKGTLVRFAQILAKAEEILGTPFDFEHGNGPRFFIILPDSRRPWNSTHLMENDGFRLFFLCECGPHTKATPGNPSPSDGKDERTPFLHLSNHEGYLIRQPVQFVEKYGAYLLVMLEMLKFGHDVAGYSLPGLSVAGSLFPASAMPSNSLTLDRINKSIAYVEKIAGLDTRQPWKLAEYLGNLRAMDGMDLGHQMASYLQMDGNKHLFSNLYRMKTAPGRTDWVCSLHHSSISGHPKDYELESTLSSVGARLDPRGKKIMLALTSSAHAEQLCKVMSRMTGLGSYRLEVVVDYQHTFADLMKLEKLIGQCDLGSIALHAPSSSSSSVSSSELPESPSLAAAYPSPDPSDRRESIDSQSSSNSGRSDSRTGSVSSENQQTLAVSGGLPDWMYRSHPLAVGESESQFNDGRKRHSVASSPYMLPNDFTEAERLDAQHYMVRYCFQGNYNVRLDPEADLKILDVATGTGVWALEMARDFPKAQVYGVDMSFIATPESRNKVVPPNCHLQLANILEGLPYPDNHFDFIYQRLLVYALTPAQRKKLNAELFRVLKPEGHVQLIESDGLIYNSGPHADIVNKLSLESAMKRSVDPKDVHHMKPGLRRVGFTQINSFNIALPVGEWGGQLGRMSRDNMHGLAHIWLKGDLGRYTHEECEATLVEIDKECEQLQSFYKIWLVVGQKPLLENP